MLILFILLGIISIILLFLFILQKQEIKSISRQLKEIKSKYTNELVHTTGNHADSVELINEINALLDDLRSSRIYYQRKNHALEQMMTNISHDLRTPLTSAMGYLEMIQNADLPSEEKSHEIAIIEKRLMRLEELINSFFEFTKVISQDTPPDMETLNLVAILEECIAHYYDDYCNEDRKILFHCDKQKQMILSNQNMLMRIFDNLINNALKHGTGNLVITCNASDHIQICFENELLDSDIDIDCIFDEFYTTDISRTKGNTGLGLAIAKQFTQMLGAGIDAEYDRKTFSIILSFPLLIQ